jgi:hypothetical protein
VIQVHDPHVRIFSNGSCGQQVDVVPGRFSVASIFEAKKRSGAM